jgi:hypothetical protein
LFSRTNIFPAPKPGGAEPGPGPSGLSMEPSGLKTQKCLFYNVFSHRFPDDAKNALFYNVFTISCKNSFQPAADQKHWFLQRF